LSRAVTIDFHNTLFHCDEWFQLEIRSLPIAVFKEIGFVGGCRAQEELNAEALLKYREIRVEAMSTGIECDAVASMVRLSESLNLGIDEGELSAGVARVMERAVPSAQPLEGAVELVRLLRERGLPLAVVSSAAYHPFLEWCLERHEMRSSFDHIVTSASCGIYKSDPGIYRHALDLIEAEPERSIHIGDSHRFDVTSASEIGMRTILLSDERDLELSPPPDAVISALGDASAELDRLLRH
jgi:HAD superfamily hydrolase (TIGR01509 family)